MLRGCSMDAKTTKAVAKPGWEASGPAVQISAGDLLAIRLEASR